MPAARPGWRRTRWGGALLRLLGEPVGDAEPSDPVPPGLEETSAEERREARWKARLDNPVDGAVLGPTLNVVGGWAIHEWRRLLGVLVTVNGRPHTFVTEFHERRDVARRWPDFPTAERAGWTAMVDLSGTHASEVVVSAYAFLEPRRRPADGGSPRMGPVRHVGTARCQVRGGSGPSGLPVGDFHQDDVITAGYVRVTGSIQSIEDVATVELRLDGASAGPARATPGGAVDAGAETITTTRFEGVVHVATHVSSVTLSALVTLVTGRSFELEPWHVDVRPPVTPPRPDAARLAVVRDRTAARLVVLSRVSTPQERRVLVATHDLNLGGGQLYLHDLMRRLARRGVRFALTSPRSGVLVDELEEMGVPVLVTGPTQVADPEGYEAQVSEIGAWAVQHGCSAVLANTAFGFTGADAGLRLGLPLTWAIHESFPFDQFWMEAFGPGVAHEYVVDRARLSLGAASRVVFEAAQTMRFYEQLLAPGAGVVVPYGVDLAAIEEFRDGVDRAALRAELGLGPDTVTMLCMGTIEPRKGQVNLARAFGQSAALRDRDVELVFVGAVPGSVHADELERLVDTLDDDRIRIEPVQPDVYRWYHACDVLVCASDVESLPRSMLEAMAFGRPVASTAVFGIPELVEDGASGWLCRDRDLGALATMLERVGDTGPQDRAAMGARAREVATTRHEPGIYERYYLEQLTGTQAAPAIAGADD
jgi:D-inositol-3-phosphate glycosyltransferase